MASKTIATPASVLPPAFAGGLVLRVMSGVHKGARAMLRQGELVIVGRDAECDLRLMDEQVQDRHFALLLNGPAPELRPFGAALKVNGNAVSGERLQLPIPCELQLGEDCTVTLDTPDGSGAVPNRRAVGVVRSTFGFMAWATVLLCAALASTAFYQPFAQPQEGPDTMHGQRIAIEQRLAAHPGGADLALTAHGAQWVIAGVVAQSVRSAIETELAAANYRPAPIVNLTSDDEVVAQIKAVFASNGYAAQVEYLGQASARVSNLDGANPAVARVAEHARHDVVGLRELTVLPAMLDVEEPPPLSMADIGGSTRLSRIVDGETAYLASTDGGRYFVGSVLPSGHRVRQITKQAVQLDSDGRLDWVRF